MTSAKLVDPFQRPRGGSSFLCLLTVLYVFSFSLPGSLPSRMKYCDYILLQLVVFASPPPLEPGPLVSS